MAKSEKESLSVADAKRRLRAAARGLEAAELVRRHPYSSLALAFMGGALTADERVAGPLLRNRLLWGWLTRDLLD